MHIHLIIISCIAPVICVVNVMFHVSVSPCAYLYSKSCISKGYISCIMHLCCIWQKPRFNGNLRTHEPAAASGAAAYHVQRWCGECPLDDPYCWLHTADHHQLKRGAAARPLPSSGRPSA